MDFAGLLRELRARKEKVERAIRLFQELQELEDGSSSPPVETARPKRRGRRNMDSEERRQVSARMKRYWASRKGESQQVA
jgi:hypothetical protein